MRAMGPKQTCRKTQSMSLLGVKRTCRFAPQMSAFDPKRKECSRLRVSEHHADAPRCPFVTHMRYRHQKHVSALLAAKIVQRFVASALVERVAGPLDPVRIAGRP